MICLKNLLKNFNPLKGFLKQSKDVLKHFFKEINPLKDVLKQPEIVLKDVLRDWYVLKNVLRYWLSLPICFKTFFKRHQSLQRIFLKN